MSEHTEAAKFKLIDGTTLSLIDLYNLIKPGEPFDETSPTGGMSGLEIIRQVDRMNANIALQSAVSKQEWELADRNRNLGIPPVEKLRGATQTVRMDHATLKALKYASIDRGMSQNDIMLSAIRQDLGLE